MRDFLKGLARSDWTVDWRWGVTTGAHTQHQSPLSSPAPSLFICDDDMRSSLSPLQPSWRLLTLAILTTTNSAGWRYAKYSNRQSVSQIMDLEFPNPEIESLETAEKTDRPLYFY